MLGDLLRKKREEKKLSLADIEKGTNIRKLYIQAIEDGNYDKLPGEVFLKGFIKTYAKFLGLDGQALVEQYKAEKAGIAPQQETATEVTTPASKTAANSKSDKSTDNLKQAAPKTENKPVIAEAKNKPSVTSPEQHKQPARTRLEEAEKNTKYLHAESSSNKKNIVIVVIILIIVIVGAVAYLSSQGGSSNTTSSAPTTEQQQPAQQPAAQPQQPAPVSGAEVSATFDDDCWTEVKVDGKVVLSETVKKGSTLNWKGAKQIDISVGNAGAINVTFNNQPVGKLGDVGAVVTKSFVAPDQQQAQQPAAQPQQPQTNANAANQQQNK